MVDLQFVIWIVLYLVIAGAVFGLLFWLTYFIEGQFPSTPMSLFCKVARVFLVVLAVLVLIGVLTSMISGTPLFYWGARPAHGEVTVW